MMDEFKTFVHDIVDTKHELQQQIREQLQGKPLFQNIEAVGSCPSCSKPIVERKDFYGCSGYQAGCKVTIPKLFLKAKVTAKMARSLLDGNEVLLSNIPGQYGAFSLFVRYEDGKLQTRKPLAEDLGLGSCPECGKSVLEKEKFYGCSGFKEGCRFTLPKKFLGKTLTTSQVRKLLKNGKTDIIKGLTGKQRIFDAALRYDAQERRLTFVRN